MDTIKLSAPAVNGFWELPVLFEDAHLLALDKPSGLLQAPDRSDPDRPDLVRLLRQGIVRGVAWAKSRNLTYVANAHRLDPECSGVALFAKDKSTLVALADLFGTEKPILSFLALVQGAARPDAFDVDARLAAHPTRPGVVHVNSRRGKRSSTRFSVQERFEGYALLRAQPTVARPHQIRAHLQHRHLPLVGDPLYGGPPLLLSRLKPDYHFKRNQEERPLIGRPALHFECLEMAHPTGGAPVVITAPWPNDLAVAVKYLRRFAPAGGPAPAPSGAAIPQPAPEAPDLPFDPSGA